MNDGISFGNWVRRRRKALDLTQEELAQRVGCALVTIRKIEYGERSPSRQVAQRLADQLDVPEGLRTSFLQAARAELAADRLVLPAAPTAMLRVTSSSNPQNFPTLRIHAAHANNIPVLPTMLIGREREVASLRSMLLRGKRLLTLTGPGGIGKTRLAVQVAAELLTDFADGVWLVDLAPVSDPGLVLPTIMQTLGLKEQSGQGYLEQLQAHLRKQQLLLILDNFEQVVAAAPEISKLLAVASDVRVLVTSRIVLRIRGEQEFTVPPLSAPDPQQLPAFESLMHYGAVRLFAERARAVKADFAVTQANAAAVAAICAQLDGLPLAIELAAARVRLFSSEALLARLHSPLKMLTVGPRDLPARQQTLRRTIDWSYQLLDEASKILFARLAIFVGGWTLEAAEAICTLADSVHVDILDGLSSLIDQSLLRRVDGLETEPRVVMLETLREYALERLMESGEYKLLQRYHALYYVALAEAAVSKLRGAHQLLWLNRLEQEHDNLRAALAWALEQETAEWAGRLASTLWQFWWERGYLSEGRRWLDLVLTKSSSLTTFTKANALVGAGFLAGEQAEYDRARAFLSESLTLFDELQDIEGTARSLKYLGRVALYTGDYTQALEILQKSLHLSQQLTNKQPTADVLNHLGLLALYQADYEQVRSLCQASLRLFRELDDKHGIAACLHNLGWAALNQGAYEEGSALCEESLALSRAMKRTPRIAALLIDLGYAALYQGAYPRAATLCREALVLYRHLNNQEGIAFCLEGMAEIAALSGAIERAVKLFGAAEALRDTTHAPLPPLYRAFHDRSVAAARIALDEAAFASAWSTGQAMSLQRAITFALETEIQ